MAEYIEREAVLAKMVTGWIVSGIEDDVVTVDDIESIPAADVAPVVRCKDCKNWKKNPWGEDGEMVCKCWVDWLPTEDDDFCSRGERRADNG